MAKLKLGAVAVCDAVYRDVATNKAILAGVYAGDIVVTQFPASLPLAFYIEIWSTEPPEIDVQFWLDDKHIGGGVASLDQSAGAPIMLMLSGVHLVAERPSEFSIKIAGKGLTKQTILRKTIRLA